MKFLPILLLLFASLGQQPSPVKPFGTPDAPPTVQQPVVPPGGLPAPPAAPCEWKEVTLPSSNKIKGLELPPDQTIPGTKRFVLINAVTDKPEQEVQWLVIGSVPWSQPSAITIANSKTLQVFPAGHQDLIVVMAYSSLDGKLTGHAVHRIQVDGPQPPPQPAAGPAIAPAAKVTGPLHLTLLVSDMKEAPQFSADGVKVHAYDAKTLPPDMRAPFNAVGGVPAYLIQSSAGDILAKGKFSTVYDLTAAVAGVRGQ